LTWYGEGWDAATDTNGVLNIKGVTGRRNMFVGDKGKILVDLMYRILRSFQVKN
jgi:hypothetical protein